MATELTNIMTGNDTTISNFAEIKDKTVRNATKGMVNAVKAGQKSGWQFAYHASVVKEAFAPGKGIAVSEELKEQFGTIKGYCEAVGISTASIHNSAKAVAFMSREGLVPSIIGKDGKSRVDFDRFTLNVAQAVELAAMTKEQFKAFLENCEQAGLDYTGLSSGFIRKWLRDEKKLTEGRHLQVEDKEQEQGKEQGKEQEIATTAKGNVVTVSENEVSAYNPTKEEVIALILSMMERYDVTMVDLANAKVEA